MVNLTLDELNLILASDADVRKEFKTAVVGLVAKFQSTGRKFGMGIRLAAQSIHLEDLGDKDKIRG
ncbi:conjugal transfer protein TraA, partial [Streptomyces sp. SID3343]|nr:conjugal transfer protein TraA [Streptomyces sp. SID3343]